MVQEGKEKVKVILVEAFNGQKYIVRLDRAYKESLTNLFESLLSNDKMGSVACVSVRWITDEEYNKVPADPIVTKQKGNDDGKEKDANEKSGKQKPNPNKDDC